MLVPLNNVRLVECRLLGSGLQPLLLAHLLALPVVPGRWRANVDYLRFAGMSCSVGMVHVHVGL